MSIKNSIPCSWLASGYSSANWYTCNLETNVCEAPVVVDDGTDDDTEDSEGDSNEEEESLPNTNSFSDDPVFYTILSMFLITSGYLLYAGKKYGRKEHRD